MWSKKRLSPTESTRIRPKPSNPDAFRTTHARSPPNTAKPRRILDHQTTRPLDHEQRTTTAHGSQPYRAGDGSGGYDHHAQHPYPPFPRTQREQCTDQTTGPPQYTPTRPINDPEHPPLPRLVRRPPKAPALSMTRNTPRTTRFCGEICLEALHAALQLRTRQPPPRPEKSHGNTRPRACLQVVPPHAPVEHGPSPRGHATGIGEPGPLSHGPGPVGRDTRPRA